MNEILDLTKILKGCPIGAKFYSAIYDEIYFKGIELHSNYPIIFDSDVVMGDISLTKEGRELRNAGECIVFPSKDQRDWSKFERFWDKKNVKKFDPKTFQPFDKVLARDNQNERWQCDFFAFMEKLFPVMCAGVGYKTCIPYNDDTKHLIGTKDDCTEYYKWWEE